MERIWRHIQSNPTGKHSIGGEGQMVIRQARIGEDSDVLAFYHDLIDRMQGQPYCPYWKKGVYPTLDVIHSAISRSQMSLATEENRIAGAFILNRVQGEGYDRVPWRGEVAADEVGVLHLLAVHPDFQGRGLGRALLESAVALSRSKGHRVIRLDTLTWNLPGRRLYEGFGFQWRGDFELTYPTTGTIPFSVYELEISDGDSEES